MALPLEVNPFALNTAVGLAIKSITLDSNLDWLDVPVDPMVGENAILEINARNDIGSYKVFATGVASDIPPSMISLSAGHIPNIEISQVNGLQSAINSIVKSFVPSSGYISVTDNGSGGYTITPNIGTSSNTLASGNDTRFPASVTGLRKGAGAGSADTAAVARTDYWDTSDFIGSGSSSRHGLVPNPGSTPGTSRFLREDGSWFTPPGSGTVTSVSLTAPSEFNVSGFPVTTSGTIAITKANQSANLVFAGPTDGSAVAPTFRSLVFADLTGLTGNTSTKLAIGNDSRFPSSVTGLRKGAGAGSADTAAVAGTDYWDTTVFHSAGPSHAIGLVPDPGSGFGGNRFLRDDATWSTFTPAAASLTNAMLSTMSAKTLKANATSGVASPADVDAKTARSVSLLNLESATSFGDANYTALPSDKYVFTSATFTAPRTVYLPLANTFNPSQQITISDDFGGINGTNVLNISRQGSDTIQGSSAALVMDAKFGSYHLTSDGNSKWFVTRRSPSAVRKVITASSTYTTPTGVKLLFVEAVGGGAGGAGALGASSQCSAGGGGGGGGYSNKLISSPTSSYSVVIGARGDGGAAGVNNGANGSATTFGGTIVNAGGGSGGASMASGTTAIIQNNVAPGGQFGAGDNGGSGDDGGYATRLSGTSGASGRGGGGAIYSGQTRGVATQSDGVSSPSTNFGGGGGGALSLNTTGQAGGNGTQGCVIVTEFY